MDLFNKRKEFQDLMTNVSQICDEIMVILMFLYSNF